MTPEQQSFFCIGIFCLCCRSGAPTSAHWALGRDNWTWNGCPMSLRPSGCFAIHVANFTPISFQSSTPDSISLDCHYSWLDHGVTTSQACPQLGIPH
ncbi:hypothetical protein J3F83DRAFT_739208 [Trichoderma novae-zelandiae]